MNPQQTTTELREKVKVALHRTAIAIDDPNIRMFGAEADAVLAALGLDDFDVAVKRMADWEWGDWYDREDVEGGCRAALRVALGLEAELDA